MKAALLHEINAPLSIDNVELDACGPREVRIQVAASGLCHSDLHVITGDMPGPLPVVLGHEASGIVVEVGSEVRWVVMGDHVVTSVCAYCGHCNQCLKGSSWRCLAKPARGAQDRPRITYRGKPVRQMAGLGALAEEMLVPETAVAVMPKEMPLDRAAVLGCAVVTGVGAVINAARVQMGESVAVIGCGGIGLNVIQGARLAGAKVIIAIDKVPSKLALAQQFGATHVILADLNAAEAAIEISQGGVDHAFEAIGLKATQALGYSVLAPGGQLTLIGLNPVGQELALPGAFSGILTEKRVQGSFMGSSAFQLDLPRYASLYLQGRLKLDELISARLQLTQVNEGFEVMKSGAVARSVVVFDDVLRHASASA